MEYMVLNRYINEISKKNSEATCKGYESDIRLFLDDVYKLRKIDNEIELLKSLEGKENYNNVAFVQDVFNDMEKKYKKSSINKKIISVSLFFYYLVRVKLLKESPVVVTKHTLDSDNNKEKNVLNKDEMLHILNVIDSKRYSIYEKKSDLCSRRDKLLLSLMFCTGLRISEAVGIKFSDMDVLENGIMVNINDHKTVKTNGIKRIPIANKCLELYEAYIEERSQLKNIADKDSLFLSYRGNGLTKQACNNAIKKIIEYSGIGKKITPHCQRHSFKNVAIANNVNLELILMIGGWSLKGMSNVYNHDNEDLDQAKISATNLL